MSLNPVKVKNPRLTVVGFSDISTIKPKDDREIIQRNNWHIVVDERIGYKVSKICDIQLLEPTCAQFEQLKQANKPVKVD